MSQRFVAPKLVQQENVVKKERDTARRQKRKFEEMESIVPGDLPAKVARKELQTTKVRNKSRVRKRN